jgi:hypothetical protein
MLLGNQSGSGCAVLALLLRLIDGGDLPAHSGVKPRNINNFAAQMTT